METNTELIQNVNTGRIDKLRWVTAFLQMFVGTATAFVYCISVFVGPLSTEFGWDPSVIVLAYTAMMIVGLPGSAAGSYLKKKFGNKNVLKIGGICFAICTIASSFATNAWIFVFFFGCLASFFMYVVYVVQLANVGELFPDKRGLSMGLVIAGITVGSALISPISEWLTRQMDVMHSILLQGAVYGAIVFVAGFLIVDAPEGYRPKNWNPPETVMDDDGSVKNISWTKALRMKSFWLFIIAMMANGVFLSGYQGNAIMLTQSVIGGDAAQAAWLYSLWLVIIGGAGMVLGYQSDKFSGPLKTMVMYFAVGTVAVAIFCIFGCNDLWAFVVLLVGFAFTGGVCQSLAPAFLMDAFGSKDFGVLFGCFVGAGAIGSLIGPQITTRFDPSVFFYAGVVLFAIAAVLLFLAAKVYNKEVGVKRF